ncbi:SDR family oxidoreductase [uncultured Paraglaciecola sp.]|uniref:SDR family oxidoreductase n=1 Tax=uncultured Paraglaciecola sp. TaxID=1765024 RepID=UPI002636BD1A|nr:SDR family oxidoreductase [uncultured Paraglaciecola sp.]
MRQLSVILLSIMLLVSFNGHTAQQSKSTTPQKAVLVTGSNSGLGLRMTQELSQHGFYVYAGVLHKHEMKAMNAMKNVTAVQFDVRNQNEIDAAVNFVEKQGRGLYGLINNAGVAVFGPMLELPLEQLQYQLDVNVFGPYRVTQAFAPMIIESQGRIATTGSIAGILSSSMFGAYSMSKHAVEAYTDALSKEMARFDVSVHVIEPGNYASNIGNAAKKLLDDTQYWTDDSQYKKERDNLIVGLAQTDKGADPVDVGRAALHIMQSDSPKIRYMVTATEQQADATVRRQISKMLELNNGQLHQFDRARLIKMLDEEMAKAAKK